MISWCFKGNIVAQHVARSKVVAYISKFHRLRFHVIMQVAVWNTYCFKHKVSLMRPARMWSQVPLSHWPKFSVRVGIAISIFKLHSSLLTWVIAVVFRTIFFAQGERVLWPFNYLWYETRVRFGSKCSISVKDHVLRFKCYVTFLCNEGSGEASQEAESC